MRDSLEYRVLGYHVWIDEEESWQAITFALKDLGVPCGHPKLEGWLKHRYWGGVFCAFPCINGCYLFGTDSLYTDTVADRVRKVGVCDPELGDQLRKRVVDEGDFAYFYDGFMIDQFVLGAFDKGNVVEAHNFLTDVPNELKQDILHYNADLTPEYVDNLYESGADQVIVFWVQERHRWSDREPVYGRSAVRLPTQQPQRQQLIDEISKRRLVDGCDKGLRDYGQLFAWP